MVERGSNKERSSAELRVWQRGKRWLLLAAATVACAGVGTARAALLDFASPGLAWTVTDVRTASVSMESVDPAAPKRTLPGCLTHCTAIERSWAALLAAARTHADLDQRPDWQLVVVQHADVEAQSLPGGQVVVSEAFVRRRGLTEAEIAFVIAHEIAHVMHQHERQLLTAALSLLPRDTPRTVGDVYVEMDFNMSLLRSLEVVMHQGEFEADETAMYLTALAGYEPSDTLRFLESERAGEQTSARILSTHPGAAARLEAARRCIPLARRMTEHGRQHRGE